MPLHQKYTFTTANQYVHDFAAFAASNGWIIDFNGAYLASWWRVHLHKGAAHFEMRSTSATAFSISGCTGYTAGTTPVLQPGYSGFERSTSGMVVGQPYYFASAVGALYFTKPIATSFETGSFFIVSNKIGNWTDGHGLFACTTGLLPDNPIAAAGGYAVLYYAGQWSASAQAGGLSGSGAATDLHRYLPSSFNAGLVFLPFLLSLAPTYDSSKRIPLGFAPGLYRSAGGDIYDIDDEILIGADTYIIWPYTSNYINAVNTKDIVIKLGA